MAAYSKHQFIAAIRHVGCNELVHPWTSNCSLFFLDVLSRSLRGSYKFFLVMHLVQLILKGRNVTREYLKKDVRGFIRSTLFGGLICSMAVATSCLFRYVLGKYYYFSFAFIPTILSCGTAMFVERPSRRMLFSFTFAQMCVEYFLRVVDTSGVVALTKGRETLFFMCCNATLLYLLKTDSSQKQSYWFFRPAKVEETGICPTSKCKHHGPCWKFILKNASKYMSIGLGIQFLRILLKKTRKVFYEPRSTLRDFLSHKETFELGSFLGAYIGIYTCVTCLLCRYYHADADSHAGPAGFLAGSAYWLHPNRTIGASVITNTLQLLLRRGISSGVVPVIPYSTELLFALSGGILFNARFVDAERCPRFIINTISVATGGRADLVYRNLGITMEKFFANQVR